MRDNKRLAQPARSGTGIGRTLLTLLMASLLLASPPLWAAGQLMVAPTRIVFDERDRSATVNLANTGDETTSYRISFVNKRMTDNGDFVDVDEPLDGERFSADMIRFSPRVVNLPPGKSQTVRLMLRKPANLEAGEYRSHMQFKAMPPETNKSIESLAADAEENLTIQLTPVIGITIPVIVRHGTTEAELRLDGLSLNKTDDPDVPLVLGMTMHRNGNRSVYGDITVFFTDPKGEELVIGKARGVAIYTPNPLRHIRMKLTPPPGLVLSDGQMRVLFEENGGPVTAQRSVRIE